MTTDELYESIPYVMESMVGRRRANELYAGGDVPFTDEKSPERQPLSVIFPPSFFAELVIKRDATAEEMNMSPP